MVEGKLLSLHVLVEGICQFWCLIAITEKNLHAASWICFVNACLAVNPITFRIVAC